MCICVCGGSDIDVVAVDDRLLHVGLSAEDADRYLKGKNGYHGLFLLRTGKKDTYTLSVR